MDGTDGSGRLGKVLNSAAGSEILDAGQSVIAGMRLTTGWGEPEQGEAFGDGAAAFTGAGQTVTSASPRQDWEGAASLSYAFANRRQAARTASLALLDRDVQTLIARGAYQIGHHRDKLDDQSDYLADLGYATGAVALIPGVGNAMKAAFELAAVNAALTVCSLELRTLSQETSENAAQLRGLAGEYSSFVSKTAPPGLDELDEPVDEEPPADDPSDSAPATASFPEEPAPVSDGTPSDAPAAPVSVSVPAPAAPAPVDPGVQPAASAAPPAMPPDAMSAMTSAFGAVGGMIGSVVAPLAAVLTGVAAAAGQSLSTLTSDGAPDTAAPSETDPSTADDDTDGDTDDDTDGHHPETDGAVPDDAGDGAVPDEVVAETGAPVPAAELEQPPPAPVPPAATRPPQ